MKTTFLWFVIAAIIGCAAGAVLGYWEARPWTMPTGERAAVKQAGEAPAPKLPSDRAQASIDETTFNFDKMESGTKQRHAFPIKNTGKSPLDLQFVSHTCKCTKVELNGKEVEPGAGATVKPGESVEVLLEWAAKVPAGPFRHGATFTTNAPEHSRIELMVEGDIVDSTSFSPSVLNFGSVNIGTEGKAEMVVTSFVEPEVEILSYEVLDEKLAKQISIRVEKVDKADLATPEATAAARIIATYTPDGSIGPFTGDFNFKTNLQRAPSLTAPIYGSVKGDISIFGKGWTEPTGTLRLSPATSATGTSSRLNVSIRGDHAKETKLTVARVTPAELKATLGEPRAIRDNLVQIPLNVEVPPGTRPMVMAGEDQGGEGEIILATTHPDTPEVRLKVTFTVKP